jgi:hypothetical protein
MTMSMASQQPSAAQDETGAVSPAYVRGMERLINVVQELSLARSFEAVRDVVRRAARDLTKADGATFVLRDGEQCYYLDEDAIGPLWKGQRFPLQACISGWVMVHRSPAVVEDIYGDPRVPLDAYRSTFVKSLAMVPIRTASPIGAIGNYWAGPHRATGHELQLLQALADSTSVALESVQLYAELEQRVRERTRDLQLANAELEAFSYTVSHDLRAPLRAVDGFSKVLCDRYAALLDAQGRNYLERVRVGAQRMGQLIDDLLDLARISRFALDRSPLDLAELGQQVIAELRRAQPERSVVFTAPVALPATGDARMVRILLENLLGNAWKFSAQRVEAHVELGTGTRGGGSAFFVRDDGAGFDPRHVERLFTPFQRLHTEGEFEGTGIGLATVKRIVARHGGEAWAEGTPGQGATFWFTLDGPGR